VSGMTRATMKIVKFFDLVTISLGISFTDAIAQEPITIPAGIAGATDSGKNRGFRVISAQAPDFTEIPNSYLRALQQLNGTLKLDNGEAVEDEAIEGPNADGSFDVDLINFEKDANPEISALTNFPDDTHFPGIPGTGGHSSLFTTEILTFLELSAGEHTLNAQLFVGRVDATVSNDNGFRVFTGTNPRDFFATELATFVRPVEAPAFSSVPWDYQFKIIAPEEGIYPIRIVYWAQASNAALELSNEGDLVNDDDGIAAFKESTDTKYGHAYIADVSPRPGVADISASDPIEILLRDDETTVMAGSVNFSFNDVDVTGQVIVETNAGRTTITYQPPTGRQSERNEVSLDYRDSAGQTFTNRWDFKNTLGDKPPKVTGQWDFSHGLQATLGSDLQFNDAVSESETQFGTTTSFEIPDIGGEPADVMFVPEGSQVGYLMTHGIAPNGGGLHVNRYTLIMDVLQVGGGGASAIIQASPTKNPGDATFFWQGGNMGQGGGGYNGEGTFYPWIEGQTADEDAWHRIAFAVDLADEKVITKWVDGVLQDEWVPQSTDHIRRSMEQEVILFYDVDERSPWYVNSIQILDGKLSNQEMEALGGPTAEGFEAPNATGLQLSDIVQKEDGSVTITWDSRAGRSYIIDASADLQEWEELTDSHPSQGDATEFTENAESVRGATTRYYRVTEE
jgi:hypothetical protein